MPEAKQLEMEMKQMENNALTTRYLALQNLKRKPLRTVGLLIIVALVATVIYAGGLFSAGLSNGLESMKSRLGADLMIVPTGYDEGVEGILLKGEPSYFYFDKSVEQDIQAIPGVRRTSSQFYLTSLNQDCCSIPVQFIGFDSETDFSIQPWISEVYSESVGDGELVIGSDITVDENNQLKFFGKYYDVAAKLDETGTGLDQAVYANRNTLMHLFEEARSSGLAFTENINPENSISNVLVELEDGYDADAVIHDIRSHYDGLQVIKTKNMITGIAGHLEQIRVIFYLFAAVFLVIALVVFTLVFSVIANERKKEFAILRILGATRGKLVWIIISEALLLCGLGGVIGLVISNVGILSFTTFIGDSISLPYLLPGISAIVAGAVATLIIILLLGPVSTGYIAYSISRVEAYRALKEGE